MAISVLLVDDHELIRQGLRRAFERDGDFTVAGEAGSLADARRLIALMQPDVVILDVRLPDGNGIEACRVLRGDDPELGIVILTMYAGDDTLFDALEAGASAFVPKNAPSEDVVAAARHAASAPRSFTSADLNEAMRRKMSPTGPQLSPREREVLALLADGLGVAQISRQLFISESTTKTHISKLYDKLGAGNRAQALMTALRLGLLKRDEPGL
jgi:DNA-binding NarL/FixJ family response regulator